MILTIKYINEILGGRGGGVVSILSGRVVFILSGRVVCGRVVFILSVRVVCGRVVCGRVVCGRVVYTRWEGGFYFIFSGLTPISIVLLF